MKLLLIDSENTDSLETGLKEAGYSTDTAHRMEEAVDLFHSSTYDLVISDARLAAASGFRLLNEISRNRRQTLALVTSPKDAVQERVQALELGADASLIKPFDFPELLATVHSLIRRGSGRKVDIYNVADLEVDVVRHYATRSGAKLELTPKEFALLSFLIRNSGETVTRAQISEQVWDAPLECDTNIVDVHIRRLRAKLDDPYEVKLIQTVRGVGYTLQPR